MVVVTERPIDIVPELRASASSPIARELAPEAVALGPNAIAFAPVAFAAALNAPRLPVLLEFTCK